jgi:RNA polymerase sigma factor (TIGR02999 family)
MPTPPDADVTRLLLAWGEGDATALDALLPLVHDELNRIAHRYMSRERPDHTLQTTAVVNEAYLRLVDQRHTRWQNRAQFFGIAAQILRRLLIVHARSHGYAKRGAGAVHVALDEEAVLSPERAAALVELDAALDRLLALDPRKGRVVELRYFGGLSVDETAAVLGVAAITVMRDWSLAKAWLQRELAT